MIPKELFLIINGKNILLLDNHKKIIKEIPLVVPKKHNRGGLREDYIKNYRKNTIMSYVNTVVSILINMEKNIKRLFISGSQEYIDKLSTIINKSSLCKKYYILGNTTNINKLYTNKDKFDEKERLEKEKNLLKKLYSSIQLNDNKYCIGKYDTLQCLNLSAISILLISKYEENTYNHDNICIITDRNFYNTYQGIAGLLKYPIDLSNIAYN